MEMPVLCPNCKDWVELDSCRESPLDKNLLCPECYHKHDKVNDYAEEVRTIQLDLDNNEEYMRGDRRGWKKNLKELKEKIKALGFDPNDVI